MGSGSKTIVLTGGSSGIGEAAAKQLARRGDRVCLVARRVEELERVKAEIESAGGQCWIYPADLSCADASSACAQAILDEHPRIDVLINNAARSIRRPIRESLDRAHDYERTIEINYLGAVRLTLAFLPRFLEQQRGHVIFSSTLSTQVPIPLFSAYLASKSALESFARSLAAEMEVKGIAVTTLHFPMVRTAMSSRTRIYKRMPMISADKAATWMVEAIDKRPVRTSQPFGVISSIALAALPGPVTRLSQYGFRWMDRQLAKRVKD